MAFCSRGSSSTISAMRLASFTGLFVNNLWISMCSYKQALCQPCARRAMAMRATILSRGGTCQASCQSKMKTGTAGRGLPIARRDNISRTS
jgi:hypothetical protein